MVEFVVPLVVEFVVPLVVEFWQPNPENNKTNATIIKIVRCFILNFYIFNKTFSIYNKIYINKIILKIDMIEI